MLPTTIAVQAAMPRLLSLAAFVVIYGILVTRPLLSSNFDGDEKSPGPITATGRSSTGLFAALETGAGAGDGSAEEFVMGAAGEALSDSLA
jgi:hypothetical protein